jgi:hypothetical protein
MVSFSGTIGHGICGPIYILITTLIVEMNPSTSVATKKAVLVRIPAAMYEDLLNLSATAILLQRKSVSVPSLVVELLEEALQKRAVR